jgi:hypothetical protein
MRGANPRARPLRVASPPKQQPLTSPRNVKVQLWSYNYAPEPTGIGPVSTVRVRFGRGRRRRLERTRQSTTWARLSFRVDGIPDKARTATHRGSLSKAARPGLDRRRGGRDRGIPRLVPSAGQAAEVQLTPARSRSEKRRCRQHFPVRSFFVHRAPAGAGIERLLARVTIKRFVGFPDQEPGPSVV